MKPVRGKDVVVAETRHFRTKARRVILQHKIAGRAGERAVSVVSVYIPHRITELYATDSLGGKATRIWRVLIDTPEGDARDQTPRAEHGMDTSWFEAGTPRCQVEWEPIRQSGDVKFEIEFLEDCEWSATTVGDRT